MFSPFNTIIALACFFVSLPVLHAKSAPLQSPGSKIKRERLLLKSLPNPISPGSSTNLSFSPSIMLICLSDMPSDDRRSVVGIYLSMKRKQENKGGQKDLECMDKINISLISFRVVVSSYPYQCLVRKSSAFKSGNDPLTADILPSNKNELQ